MRIIRDCLLALCLMTGMAAPALARLNIDIHLDMYPHLEHIPGYPVYYAPRLGHNYFFYDGLYWVFEDGDWFVSDWYNGPWDYVDPYEVPVFVLRVPVRYYRHPPAFFHGWHHHAPPRWGHRWGERWEHDRRGWDKWDHRHVPVAAQLPRYQRDYSRDRYPGRAEQHNIRERHYNHRPSGVIVRDRDRDNVDRNTDNSNRDRTTSGPRDRDRQHDLNDSRPQPRADNGRRHDGDKHNAKHNASHNDNRGDQRERSSVLQRSPANLQPAPRSRDNMQQWQERQRNGDQRHEVKRNEPRGDSWGRNNASQNVRGPDRGRTGHDGSNRQFNRERDAQR